MDKILVFKDHIEIYINVVPNDLLGAIDIEIDKSRECEINAQSYEENEKTDAETTSVLYYNFSMGKNNLAPQAGFEPATYRLTAECSTVELLRNIN